MSALTLISEHGCFGGVQRFYKHDSREIRGPMKFSAYLPPQARTGKVPVLYYLSGLTCTEETFPIKAHAQQVAAELGLMLIAPDTSPREPRLPGDADSWTSATQPASMWTPHRPPGRNTIGCTVMSRGSCRSSSTPTFRRWRARPEFSAIQWVGTVRWCARCAIPTGISRFPHSRPLRRRCK